MQTHAQKKKNVETSFCMEIDGMEIYMECPEDLESYKNKCLVLNKTITGLVQSDG